MFNDLGFIINLMIFFRSAVSMRNGKILNKIKSMKFTTDILSILSLILSVVFTLVGTVIITLLVKYLYEVVNFNFLACLLMVFILPSIYSTIINSILKHIDDKIYNILSKVDDLEEEKIEDYSLSNEQYLVNIKSRFEGLTIDNQLKVLKFIKDNIPMVTRFEEFSHDDMLMLLKEFDDIESCLKRDEYTRKKTID